MLFLNLLSNPIIFIAFIVALLGAITVHECAHAWMANRLGDSTAKDAGRISLNPFVHLDLMGTIFLLLAGFGWGKPVPVNPNNLQNPKLDELKIALCGPISNLIFAIIILLAIRWLNLGELINSFLIVLAQINLILMTFNLLPIPPLDGSAILQVILPAESYQSIQQLGVPLLIAFLIFSQTTNFLSTLIDIITNFFLGIFL